MILFKYKFVIIQIFLYLELLILKYIDLCLRKINYIRGYYFYYFFQKIVKRKHFQIQKYH